MHAFDIEEAPRGGVVNQTVGIPTKSFAATLGACVVISFIIGRFTASNAPPAMPIPSSTPTPTTPTAADSVLCEDRGLVLPEEIRKQLDRPLTDEEEQASFQASHLEPSSGSEPFKGSPKPIAHWIIGPSGSGKSFCSTAILHSQASIPVVMDGDNFRNAHQGYQAATFDGQQNGCVWRAGWETVKPYRTSWRTKLWYRAVESSRDLLIVEVCTNLNSCLSKMEELKERGYTNDIYVNVVKESVVYSRGLGRQVATGKRFGPSFRRSMESIVPLIEHANGVYKMSDNTVQFSSEAVFRCSRFGICPVKFLKEGNCSSVSSYPGWVSERDTKVVEDVREVVDKFVGQIEARQDGGAHLPLCEDLGTAMDASDKDDVNQDYTADQLAAARAMSQIDAVPSQEHPVAIWLIGPAGVGKSTARQLASELLHISDDILPDASTLDGRRLNSLDAVTLDGEFYRKVHLGFQQVVEKGRLLEPPCIWKRAWDGSTAKKRSKELKKQIFKEAVAARKNLIIPSSCVSGFQECLNKIYELRAAGYTNHMLVVYAKASLVDSRGMSRSDFNGFAYTSMAKKSQDILGSMLAAVDGKWALADNSGVLRRVSGGTGSGLPRGCAEGLRGFNPYMPLGKDAKVACNDHLSKVPSLFGDVSTIMNYITHMESTPIGSHLVLCEDLGYEMPQALMADMNRPITEQETAAAQTLTFLEPATTQQRPVAVWLLGPSAVGKSTASKGGLTEWGIQAIRTGNGEETKPDAVVIDGEIFRSVHQGFKDLVTQGRNQSTPCIWKAGWKKTKARLDSKVFKKMIFDEASKAKKNLIIPSPCSSDIGGCIKRVETLKKLGYVNHMVVIYARKKLVDERGRSRADMDGKMYVSTVDDSVAAFAPMILAGNGKYSLLANSGKTRQGPTGQCPGLTITRLELFKLERDMEKLLEQYFDIDETPHQLDFQPSEND